MYIYMHICIYFTFIYAGACAWAEPVSRAERREDPVNDNHPETVWEEPSAFVRNAAGTNGSLDSQTAKPKE